MAGAEIAALLWPFVKVGGMIFAAWLAWKIISGLVQRAAVARDDLDEVQLAQKEQSDAREKIRRDADGDLDSFDRDWLRDRKSD